LSTTNKEAIFGAALKSDLNNNIQNKVDSTFNANTTTSAGKEFNVKTLPDFALVLLKSSSEDSRNWGKAEGDILFKRTANGSVPADKKNACEEGLRSKKALKNKSEIGRKIINLCEFKRDLQAGINEVNIQHAEILGAFHKKQVELSNCVYTKPGELESCKYKLDYVNALQKSAEDKHKAVTRIVDDKLALSNTKVQSLEQLALNGAYTDEEKQKRKDKANATVDILKGVIPDLTKMRGDSNGNYVSP
jgi:hypothetical protein